MRVYDVREEVYELVVPVAAKMTADEFLALPPLEGARRRELIDGTVVVHGSTAFHGDVHTNILVALVSWTRAQPSRGHAVLPRDIEVEGDTVLAPDVLWYAEGHVPDVHATPPYPLPDIAVEVRAASTWGFDVGPKKSAYERAGLPELWLVDTRAETVLVFGRAAPGSPDFDLALELRDQDAVTSGLLPGFALSISDLFRVS